jgi:hypothetical protein
MWGLRYFQGYKNSGLFVYGVVCFRKHVEISEQTFRTIRDCLSLKWRQQDSWRIFVLTNVHGVIYNKNVTFIYVKYLQEQGQVGTLIH